MSATLPSVAHTNQMAATVKKEMISSAKKSAGVDIPKSEQVAKDKTDKDCTIKEIKAYRTSTIVVHEYHVEWGNNDGKSYEDSWVKESMFNKKGKSKAKKLKIIFQKQGMPYVDTIK